MAEPSFVETWNPDVMTACDCGSTEEPIGTEGATAGGEGIVSYMGIDVSCATGYETYELTGCTWSMC